MTEDELPESLQARLAEELDAVRPPSPFPGQARYSTIRRGRPVRWVRFGAGVALGAAAVFLAGVAVGSSYPTLWTARTSGAMQRLREAVGEPVPAASTSPSPPAPQASPKPAPVTLSSPPAERESPESTSGSRPPSPEPEQSGDPTPESSSSPGSDG